jgi:hypothetical protein
LGSTDDNPDVRIERDGDAVRQVLHLTRPFIDEDATSPEDLAARYLRARADLFGIDPSTLPGPLSVPPTAEGLARLGPDPTSVETRDGESVAVIFGQIQDFRDLRSPAPENAPFGLPIWGAGVRVMVARAPLRVTSAYATLQHGLARWVPVARGPEPFPKTAAEAAQLAGVDDPSTIEGYFAYQGPDPRRRERDLIPVLVFGQEEPLGNGGRLPYRYYHDLETVIRKEVLVSSGVGLVFPVDPRSQSAQPEPGPYRPGTELDSYAAYRPLPDLTTPAPGGDWRLEGTRVHVAQNNPLGISPPAEPGRLFDYTTRTDHFAGVSAYRHCDAAFRMVAALGFPLAEYFRPNHDAGKFPIRVVHRAPIPPGRGLFDGRTVNAQVTRDPSPHVVGEMLFALGDLTDAVANPIGIAADARFTWHELGHVLLVAATGELEFRFAHSAGDALAAVICDLDSQVAASPQLAPWRGVTFPWVEALRRHDHRAEDGWAWHGSLYDVATYGEIRDPAGYRAEQIVSATLFRLYLALGGAAELSGGQTAYLARRAAAAYTAYLIVRAIRGLGSASMTPVLDAYGLAGALMDADVGTVSLLPDEGLFAPFPARPRRGGAAHKVVRWAFERQGLYAPPTGRRPWNDRGDAEPVDVYIDDGRNGAYDYAADWETRAPHLQVDPPPKANVWSRVLVKVKNRGLQPNPQPATVRVFVARVPASGPPPWGLQGSLNPWTELPAGGGATTTAVVQPGQEVEFGPFRWRPQVSRPHALLACVDAPGDRCNAHSPSLACAIGPTQLDHLVPLDNNIAYRKVPVLP